jgi:hypothetical protein
MQEDKNLNKLRNLLGFNLNLSQYGDVGPLLRQSPDYILEKYNHWIGFEPITDFPHYTPDEHILFFHQYHKTWGDCNFVKRQLIYLQETKSLNMLKMVTSFENYFGPVEKISDSIKNGLHVKIFEFSDEIIKGNKENVKVILRDMKLKDLI